MHFPRPEKCIWQCFACISDPGTLRIRNLLEKIIPGGVWVSFIICTINAKTQNTERCPNAFFRAWKMHLGMLRACQGHGLIESC